ncbi:hypothetical protein [Tsukamurella sp. NPDC003166]|uniref:hypothetical protein n=1 Tax=Tsukamurella sp. NPDC003166 TaxID=3154444 RepID=UPI0033AAE95B
MTPIPGWRDWMDDEPWRVAMVCYDSTTCTHPDHVKAARARWAAMCTLDLTGFASALHDEHCTLWMQARFHPKVMLRAATRECGLGGQRHVAHFAALPWVIELHARHAAVDVEFTDADGTRHIPGELPGQEVLF